MNAYTKLHGLPYREEDGVHIVKVGKWWIEYTPDKYAIYAYSNYVHQVNSGHRIPAELREGKPYYPFGISHLMPVYAKQAMDMLVKEFGHE